MASTKNKHLEISFTLFVNGEDEAAGMFWIPLHFPIKVNKEKEKAKTRALNKQFHPNCKLRHKWNEKIVTGDYAVIKKGESRLNFA